MTQLCLECASLAMCEHDQKPNLVPQNSHTVCVTSLFCMKLAQEMRALQSHGNDDELTVIFEAEFGDPDRRYHDAVLFLGDDIAVVVENEMSRNRSEHDTRERISRSIIGSHYVADKKISSFRKKFGVILNLSRANDGGLTVLYWLAQSIAGPRILPFAYSNRERCIVSITNNQNNQIVRAVYQINQQHRAKRSKVLSIARPAPGCPHGLAAVYVTPAPPNDEPTLCALCGAPLPHSSTNMSEMEQATRVGTQIRRTALVQRHHVFGYSPLRAQCVCVQCGTLVNGDARMPAVDYRTRQWLSIIHKSTAFSWNKYPELHGGAPYLKRIVLDKAYKVDGTSTKIAIALFPSEAMRVLYDAPYDGEPRSYQKQCHIRVEENKTLNDVFDHLGTAPFVFRFYIGEQERRVFVYDDNNIYQAYALWETQQKNTLRIRPPEAKKFLQVGLGIFENNTSIRRMEILVQIKDKKYHIQRLNTRPRDISITEYYMLDPHNNVGTLRLWPRSTTRIMCTSRSLRKYITGNVIGVVFYCKIGTVARETRVDLPPPIMAVLSTATSMKQTTQLVAIKLRCLGHIAWANLQDTKPASYERREDFLFYIWDAYLAREFAKPQRSEDFIKIATFVLGYWEKRKPRGGYTANLRACISGEVLQKLLEQMKKIDPPDPDADPETREALRIEARCLGDNIHTRNMHPCGMRGLLLQTAALLVQDDARASMLARVRDAPYA